MDQLYRWFLNQVRLGKTLAESLIKASVRWASYPVELLWNAGVAAHSSRAFAQFASIHPFQTFSSLINSQQPVKLAMADSYSQEQLVGAFPELISAPYNARIITRMGNSTTSNYKTSLMPISTSMTWDEVSKRVDEMLYKVGVYEYDPRRVFYVTFIAGIPQLVAEPNRF